MVICNASGGLVVCWDRYNLGLMDIEIGNENLENLDDLSDS